MRRVHCGPSRWHVFARGARRLQLYRDPADYENFLNCLKFALRESGCLLWAYALMSNHYHLVLFGDSDQVTACMYRVNRLYAGYHNQRYHLGGHVFDGPYQAFRLPTDGTTLWTLAYVFLNPVQAGLCSDPADYAWSGYRSFLGREGSPLALDTRSLTAQLEISQDLAWKRFHNCIRRQLQNPRVKPAGVPTMVEVHRFHFEGLLEHAEATAAHLSAEDRQSLALYWGRQCGITPRAMAAVLGGASPAGISRLLYKFRERLSQESALAALKSPP